MLDPGKPRSGFGTAFVAGVGRPNGADGARFTAVITDNGEPGKTDTFEIKFPTGIAWEPQMCSNKATIKPICRR